MPTSDPRAAGTTLSFEFFPPKTAESENRLWNTVERLEPLGPRFMSVTYGADGSTREGTHRIVRGIRRRTSLPAVPHLTCVGASRAEINALAERYWNDGFRHLVALRGDAPGDADGYTPRADGYAYALDLVAGLKAVRDFEISVACYPEGHPEAPSAQFDLEYLKRKVDAGASRAITQFFFDNDVFLRFRDRARAAGIDVPIVPGIMPVANFKQLKRFASACGSTVPRWMEQRFDGLDDDPKTRQMIAASTAIDQVEALQREGVPGFHFYTLNRAELTYAVCHAIGVRHKAAA